MINLLPPKEKEVLYSEQVKNLVAVLGCIVIISLVCLSLILLSIKFYILSDFSYQKFLFQEAEKKYQSPGLAGFKDAIQKYNVILPHILSFYKKDLYFSDILGIISAVGRPEGLYFTKISLDGKTLEDNIKVVISGISDTRENLLLFQKNLQQEPGFKNISFSPNSWISPANTNFSLNLEFPKNGN